MKLVLTIGACLLVVAVNAMESSRPTLCVPTVHGKTVTRRMSRESHKPVAMPTNEVCEKGEDDDVYLATFGFSICQKSFDKGSLVSPLVIPVSKNAELLGRDWGYGDMED